MIRKFLDRFEIDFFCRDAVHAIKPGRPGRGAPALHLIGRSFVVIGAPFAVPAYWQVAPCLGATYGYLSATDQIQ